MTQVSFVDRLVKSGSIPIHLIRAKDKSGAEAWYYILSSHEKVRMVANSEADGSFLNLSDYGQIVASGFGREPTAEAKQMLKDKYNFDADSLK